MDAHRDSDSCPSVDVAVIGGGPGGSTVAALLAARGRRVLLLEKAEHPRFHIGESLLPCNVALLEQLGVRSAVQQIGMDKWGIEFVSPSHAHRSYLEFADAWDKSAPMAWQVRRSQFDQLLFDNAVARGAQAVQRCAVREVAFDTGTDTGGATVHAVHEGRPRRFRARYVVDASGRDTLLAQQFADKQKNPRHNSAALYGHFSGAERLQGARREGHISIFWFAHGWFWFIPLADGSTSVGAVCRPAWLKQRKGPLADFFTATIALVPPLAARLKNARLIDGTVHATGNYAYSAATAAGRGWARVGDAFAFVDPVFSSGVYLAMSNAFAAAELVAAELDGSRLQAALARRRYRAHVARGPRQFWWFIQRMNTPSMRHLFMHPANVLRSKEAVLGVLAGDVYGRSPLGPSLLFFKAVYYAGALLRWRASLGAWRARRQALADGAPLPAEHNAMEPNV